MVFSKKIGVLILMAGLFCGISGFAQAKPAKGPENFRYLEQLTPEQQEKAKAIFEEGKSSGKGLKEQIKAKKSELDKLLQNPAANTAAIEAASRELGELRGKDMLNRMSFNQKLQQAGLPEAKKPIKNPKVKEGDKDKKDGFIEKRISSLPQEKQAEAKKIFEENQAKIKPVRDELRSKKADIEKAFESNDAGVIESLSPVIGELKGKLLIAKRELQQDLEKAGITGDIFDRKDKKGKKDSGHAKRSKEGKKDRERMAD